MNLLFNFGEKIQGYDYKVINEREARASAGIMFLFGIISLFTVFGIQTLFWAELFSITFILEFTIRITLNPKYAPYMVMGSLFVSNQEPEWVEAKPKQFAWILGMMLGIVMTYFIVFDIVSPIRMLTCVLCLILLFTESAFGICLGCIVYRKFNVKLEGNCPGGVCDNTPRAEYNKVGKWAIIGAFLIVLFVTYSGLDKYKYINHDINIKQHASQKVLTKKISVKDETETKENKDCTVPQWAIDMGHKDMWKKHHGC